MIAYVDNQLYSALSNRVLLRCETNIFKLYHGAAETELYVISNHLSYSGAHGNAPTNYDQRNRGDPDNSALTGLSILIRPNNILLKLILLATMWTLYC